MRRFFLCITLLTASAALLAIPAVAAMPETTIAQLQKAIDGNSVALLEKHMDINSVIDRGVEAVLVDPAALKAARQTPAIALLLTGMTANPAARTIIKNVLAQETRAFVRRGISSGAFAGKKMSGKNQGSVSPLFVNVSTGRKEFGRARLVERRRTHAIVATSLYDSETRDHYPLELRLQEEQGAWRVKEVLNVKQLVTMTNDG